jgi:hypothetical protein
VLVVRLTLRALRWRPAASATVFVVALIAIVAATIGPIYLHAANERVLAERLAAAPPFQRDVLVSRTSLIGGAVSGVPAIRWSADVTNLAEEVADRRWFAAPVYTAQTQVNFSANGSKYAGRIATIDNLCAHLQITSGHCVSADSTDETVISVQTAAAQHLAVGSEIDPTPIDNPTSIPLHVVGIYQPIDPQGTYWGPWDFFEANELVSGNAPLKLDAFLVSPIALASRIDTVAQTLGANVHLEPTQVRLNNVPALREVLAQAQSNAAALAATANFTATPAAVTVTGTLPNLLDGLSSEMSLARTLITISTAQLALLAILVLYAVVAGSAAVQGPEVALAKLRGRRPGAVLAQATLAPIVLIALATPVGAVLAWLLVRLLAPALLDGSVGVVFPPAAYGVAAIAAGGGMVAAIVAARRTFLTPIGVLLRRGSDASRSSVGLALVDAAAVTLALAALVELITSGTFEAGQTNSLSALGPTLLAIAGAVIVVRLLPIAGRLVVRATRDSPRLATFIAVRQLVRRPAAARGLVLVAVALAIASFAVVNWSSAQTNRQLRALNDAGASTVLDVIPSQTEPDLRDAVDRADPGGHSMAVAVVDSGPGTPLVAVDTRRFAGVGAWVSGNSAPGLAAVLGRLGAASPASISFTGTELRLTVTLTKRPPEPVHLAVDVTTATHELTNYDLGLVQLGANSYAQAVDCTQACRITGLSLSADTPDPTSFEPGATVAELDATVVASAGTGAQTKPVTGFDDAGRWRSDGRSTATIAGSNGQLSLVLRQTSIGGPWATLLSADDPPYLPAVVASGTAALYPDHTDQVYTVGLDDNTLPVNGVIDSVTLPQLDRVGAMVDFGAALNAMGSPAAATTQFQVWLAASAPKDMAARLTQQEVRVTGTTRASTYRRALDQSGPAFADQLFLVAAIAATILAIAATVLAAVVTARRRGYELAALTVVGIAPRTLRRALAAEQAILLGLGLIVGLAAGIGGSLFALSSTPVFVDATVGPPRVSELPWGLLAVMVAVLIVIVAATCWLVAWVVSRPATPDRLREAQQ